MKEPKQLEGFEELAKMLFAIHGKDAGRVLLTPEQVADLSPEQLAALSPEQRLAGLDPEQREELRTLLNNKPTG